LLHFCIPFHEGRWLKNQAPAQAAIGHIDPASRSPPEVFAGLDQAGVAHRAKLRIAPQSGNAVIGRENAMKRGGRQD
jgi:hypothetical protein